MERFWTKVDRSGGPKACWPWLGYINSRGYGLFWLEGKSRYAHLVGYELVKGPMPKGLEGDHTCNNKPCCNPDHLEPVTHLENVRRGVPNRKIVQRTHCKHGHEYTPENTYMYNGGRRCRICNRNHQAQFHGR